MSADGGLLPRAVSQDDWIARVVTRAVRARDERHQWVSLWQELARHFCPNRADFMAPVDDGTVRDELYETTPQLSARALASTVGAMLRPPGKRWFRAKAKVPALNMIDAVRVWLHEVTNITFEHMYDPRAQIEKNLAEADYDLVVFGTGIVHVNWTPKKGGHLVARTRSLANTVLVAGANGQPNASYSFYKYTLRQLVEEFGLEALSPCMHEAYRADPPRLDEEFEVLHAIVPRIDVELKGRKARHPWASLWIGVKDKWLMDGEKGFAEFPDICPRWDTMTGEVYGRSPAMIALAESRVIQAMAKTFLEAGEMALHPPTYSYADMINSLELWPGGHTVVDKSAFTIQGSPIGVIQTGSFPEKIFEVYQKKNENVAAAFFRDILELPSARDTDMTATEIRARVDQFLRQAAPVFARVEADYNARLVNRVFSILIEEDRYPPPPPELAGQEIEFEYESPLKAARDLDEALRVAEHLSMVAPYAQAKPDLMDNYDLDAAVRFMGAKAGVPPAIFRPIEQMMEMREHRQKLLDQAQKAQMIAKAGPALSRLGDTVVKARQSGLLGDPAELPSPALIPGVEAAGEDVLAGLEDELA